MILVPGSAAFNPSGESVVVGSFNRIHIFNYNMRRGQWEEAGMKEVCSLTQPSSA